jgi:polar amino acid transport system substrate-binding protein
MKRKILVLLLTLTVVLNFASLIEEIQERGVLKVGQDSAYMPLYGTDVEGNRIGLEAEILQKMADTLGVKLEFVVVNWDGIIPALLTNKFDIIWSGMTISPERAIKVNFSIPYMTGGQVIIYNNTKYSSPPTLKELKEDKNLKISVQLGSTGNEAARRTFPGKELLNFDTIDEAALQVATGKADIMIFDSLYANYIANKYEQVSASEEFITEENFGVAIKKGDFDTVRWIDTFITSLKTSGDFDKLKQKWLVDYEGNN